MAPDSVGALRNDLKHCENPDLLAAGFACRANSRVPADFAAVGPGAGRHFVHAAGLGGLSPGPRMTVSYSLGLDNHLSFGFSVSLATRCLGPYIHVCRLDSDNG